MSHFAVIAPPFYSHVQALQHLSQALIARGHQITFIQQTDVGALLTDSRIGFFPAGFSLASGGQSGTYPATGGASSRPLNAETDQ